MLCAQKQKLLLLEQRLRRLEATPQVLPDRSKLAACLEGVVARIDALGAQLQGAEAAPLVQAPQTPIAQHSLSRSLAGLGDHLHVHLWTTPPPPHAIGPPTRPLTASHQGTPSDAPSVSRRGSPRHRQDDVPIRPDLGGYSRAAASVPSQAFSAGRAVRAAQGAHPVAGTAVLPGRPILNPADAEAFAQLGQKAPQPRDAVTVCYPSDEADSPNFSEVNSLNEAHRPLASGPGSPLSPQQAASCASTGGAASWQVSVAHREPWAEPSAGWPAGAGGTHFVGIPRAQRRSASMSRDSHLRRQPRLQHEDEMGGCSGGGIRHRGGSRARPSAAAPLHADLPSSRGPRAAAAAAPLHAAHAAQPVNSVYASHGPRPLLCGGAGGLERHHEFEPAVLWAK